MHSNPILLCSVLDKVQDKGTSRYMTLTEKPKFQSESRLKIQLTSVSISVKLQKNKRHAAAFYHIRMKNRYQT